MSLFRDGSSDSENTSDDNFSDASSISIDSIGIQDELEKLKSGFEFKSNEFAHTLPVLAPRSKLIEIRELLKTTKFDLLLDGLKGIKIKNGNEIGVLNRLLEDLEIEFRKLKSKEYKRSLSSAAAAALLKLERGFKKEGKEMLGLADAVKEKVKLNPPPIVYYGEGVRREQLLNSVEALILGSGRGKISLKGLNLTDQELNSWTLLKELESLISWYLSFDKGKYLQGRRKELNRVRILDLSRNRLTSFPSFLVDLFPNLDTLSLPSSVSLLPPCIIKLPLRKLKFNPTPLKSTSAQIKKSLESKVIAPLEKIPRLSTIATQSYQTAIKSNEFTDSTESLQAHFNSLPLHLQSLIIHSFTCISCNHFIPSSTPSLQLIERFHFISPGISSLPTVKKYNRSAVIEKVLTIMLSRGENNLLNYFVGENFEEEGFQSIGRGEFRFCEKCLRDHLGEVGCGCFICEKERGRKNEELIRFLRR